MIDSVRAAKIKEVNARFFGMGDSVMIEKAGEGISEYILRTIKGYKRGVVRCSFICGLGNNGADGMSAALTLSKKLLEQKISNVEIKMYLLGRENEINSTEAKNLFQKIHDRKLEIENFSYVQDAYAKDIDDADILVEAILGTGTKGVIRKRYKDVVQRILKMKSYKIAVDVPVSGYKPNLVLSLITAKQKRAVVLDLGLPEEVESYLGPAHVKYLYEPPKNAYKRMTGELLVFGGSQLFHGAPIMAIKAASKFIGSVFFYTSPENRELISKQKMELQEFISLRESDLEKYAEYASVILVGPGLEENISNKAMLTYLLNKYPEKTFVLDAYAIAMANPKQNRQNKRGFRNCILTPHRGELRHIFDDAKVVGLEGKLKRFCIENKCHLVLKGSVDLLFSADGEQKFNHTGNPGMAKGGTGDIMAGIIAALACKNDPWDALMAGTFLSGLAGDLANKKYGFNFSATDEIPFLQEAYKWSLEF